MPSSVLLAILVGAGVLALMPALVRRYDSAVRGQAELRTSSMRVLLRRRRRRTVPGSMPINPPSALFGDRIVGVAAVADALTPGDSDSDALVREALTRHAARSAGRASAADGPTQRVSTSAASARSSARSHEVRANASRHGGERSRVGQSMVDASQLRDWQRFRRRRVLLAFTLLSFGQALGVAFVGSGFWAGLAVSGVLTLGYLARLRAAAAAERRQVTAERARRHRAYEFIRVATRDFRIEHGALARTASWLATPREARRRPTREVVRVLALAGREAKRAGDGTWAIRRAPEPAPVPQRPVAPRPVTRPAALVARPALEMEEPLPRAVNL